VDGEKSKEIFLNRCCINAGYVYEKTEEEKLATRREGRICLARDRRENKKDEPRIKGGKRIKRAEYRHGAT